MTGLRLQPIGMTLGWALMLFLLPLAAVFGSLATVAALIAAILLVPTTLTRDSWIMLREQPAMWIFAAVFVKSRVTIASVIGSVSVSRTSSSSWKLDT